jgi:HEAT repeat protein
MPKPLTDKDFEVRTTFWVRKLRLAGNPGAYGYCRRNIIALGAKAIPTMLKAIEADKARAPWLHWNVALILGKIGDDRALPYLLKRLEPVPPKLLKSRPEWTYVRAYAALALGKIKGAAKKAVGPLRKVAADEKESTFLRRAAVLALGTLRDKQSVELLGGILVDPQARSRLRGVAALALGMMYEEKSTDQLISYLSLPGKERDPLTDRLVVQAVGLQRKEENAELVRALLASRDEPQRQKGRKAQGAVGWGRASNAALLRGLLSSNDESLRGTTALVLAWLNDRAAAPAVEQVVKDGFAPGFTRCNAALALGNLGKRKEGGEFLRKVMQEMMKGSKAYSHGTLAYAAIALGEFPCEETLKMLFEVIRHKNSPRVVTLNALIALGHLKDPRMVPFQISQYRAHRATADQFHRGEILRALISHPPQEAIRRIFLDALRKDSSPYARQRAATGLARYPGPDTEALLTRKLDDRDYETRGQVALTLGVLKATSAVGALRKMMARDESDWVRLCARKALENIIKYGHHPTWQTAGLQKMIDKRLFRVGASLRDEMDRMYLIAYNTVLELDKRYTANKKVD